MTETILQPTGGALIARMIRLENITETCSIHPLGEESDFVQISWGQEYDDAWGNFLELVRQRRRELELTTCAPLRRVIKREIRPPHKQSPCIELGGFGDRREVEHYHSRLSRFRHDYNPLVLIYKICPPLNYLSIRTEARLVHTPPTDTLCGTLAIIGQRERRRVVTIGGVISVRDKLWACTAAHSVPEVDQHPPNIETLTMDMANLENCPEDLGDLEYKLKPEHPSKDMDKAMIIVAPEEESLHEMEVPPAIMGADAVNAAGFEKLKLLGEREGFGSDWSLIPIEDRALALPNSAQILDRDLYLEDAANQPGDGEVIVLAGVSGQVPATMALGQTEVPLPSGHWITAWECVLKPRYALNRGDSGSWIVDPHKGTIFGQVVATMGKSVFMLPMKTLLEEASSVQSASLVDAQAMGCLPSSRALLATLAEYYRDFRQDTEMAQRYDKAAKTLLNASNVPDETSNTEAPGKDDDDHATSPRGVGPGVQPLAQSTMAHPRRPKRFALLVGVDSYLDSGARKDWNGSKLSISNLKGCVKDVEAVRKFLEANFQVEISILASPLDRSLKGTTGVEPSEAHVKPPTFENIKREFDNVMNQANAGDSFLFYFSGHGGRLDRVPGSPRHHIFDPSLLTSDFCLGKPAVRGWQLNRWLRMLSEKKVHVAVILDSCYYWDGGWRDASFENKFRTPNGWPVVPNLPSDEAATEEHMVQFRTHEESASMPWFINPEGFTLMTACKNHEMAAEMARGGTFTEELLEVLNADESSYLLPTYRSKIDRTAQQVRGQTPVVCGQDELPFFGIVKPFASEPLSATPLKSEVKGGRVSIPMGKIHGVCQKSEFSTYSPSSDTCLSVVDVYEFESKAAISEAMRADLQAAHYLVVPSRWSFGERTLRILVDSSLGYEFQTSMFYSLHNRIASSVEIQDFNDTTELDDSLLRVARIGDQIAIFGPESWIGYTDSVRGLDITIHTEEPASKVASIVSHLARFEQVLKLESLASNEAPQFEVRWTTNERVNHHASPETRLYGFEFMNRSKEKLYVTIISFGSGFNIQQTYPSSDFGECVEAYDMRSLILEHTVPSELERDDSVNHTRVHRMIFRVFVTIGKNVSWASLELPFVWNTDQAGLGRPSKALGRHEGDSSEFEWWVEDKEVLMDCDKEVLMDCD